ncbi:hypothetical protein TKK_0018661 [Trichogramma kaykai]
MILGIPISVDFTIPPIVECKEKLKIAKNELEVVKLAVDHNIPFAAVKPMVFDKRNGSTRTEVVHDIIQVANIADLVS